MTSEAVSFITGIDQDGKLFVEPNNTPMTRNEALATIKALQFYEANYSNAYLRLHDGNLFFKNLEELISEK